MEAKNSWHFGGTSVLELLSASSESLVPDEVLMKATKSKLMSVNNQEQCLCFGVSNIAG